MASLAIFGTELEESEENEGVRGGRKPLGIDEQVVTDERGRRRFHGAFTGGFSAGYFNTVGSKEGWIPKQFSSGRDARASNLTAVPEDFMDEEDLGEFGIATRRLQASREAGGSAGQKHQLAWERGTQSSLDSSLSAQLQEIIRPARDSMGVQLLKKMGWREGQGIGPRMSRRMIEKHKQHDDRARGRKNSYNQSAVDEAEQMAPNFQFAPSDLDQPYLKPHEGTHGIGYKGLSASTVLSEKYGAVEASLKTRQKSKGIRGQAFGIGAFEDDDDTNIYTNYDLSQYDFTIGGNERTDDPQCSSSDTSFVMAEKRQQARQYFDPPPIPRNFHPIHTPIFPNVSMMPKNVKGFGEKMNHLQRAKFLGEVDPKAVLELISDQNRERLKSATKGASSSEDSIRYAFEEEPMKQARFKSYVNYLKRGLLLPRPPEMTILEWEQEVREFQAILPASLRSMLPEVRARQQPLASVDLAAPIAEVLKSKFVSGSNHQSKNDSKSDERISAVRMKMFGEMTRNTYEWHPTKQLSKRFNLPDPYPESTLVGAPHLQKHAKTETLLNLGSTAIELGYRARKKETIKNENEDEKIVKAAQDVEVDEKAPKDFLNAIFGDSDEESDESDEDDDATQLKSPEAKAQEIEGQQTSQMDKKSMYTTAAGDKCHDNSSGTEAKPTIQREKVFTVLDLIKIDDDDEEFGPAPPPGMLDGSRSPNMAQERQVPGRSKHHHHEKKKHEHRHEKKHKKSKHRSRSDRRSSS